MNHIFGKNNVSLKDFTERDLPELMDDKQLAPLEGDLRKIWIGSWSDVSEGVSKQLVSLDNSPFQVCDQPKKCKKKHTFVQINLVAVDKKKFGRQQLYFKLESDGYYDLTLPGLEYAQSLITQLNQRLYSVCCKIFNWNARHLNSIKIDEKGDLRCRTDIYGKFVLGEGFKPIARVEATQGSKWKWLKFHLFQKKSGGIYKKASRRTGLRTQIFNAMFAESSRIHDISRAFARKTGKQVRVSDAVMDPSAWIEPLIAAFYHLLCEKQPTEQELDTINGELRQRITAQSIKTKEALTKITKDFKEQIDSYQKTGKPDNLVKIHKELQQYIENYDRNTKKSLFAISKELDQALEGLFRDPGLDVSFRTALTTINNRLGEQVGAGLERMEAISKVINRATLMITLPANMTSEEMDQRRQYNQKFVSVAFQIIEHVWQQMGIAAPKSSTDSNTHLLSPVSSGISKSMLGEAITEDYLTSSMELAYGYYEAILADFLGIDGQATKVPIHAKDLSLIGTWEQGLGRVFSCEITCPDSKEGLNKQVREAVAYLIASALAGHLTDPAYAELEKRLANESKKAHMLTEMSKTFSGHYNNHPIQGLINLKLMDIVADRNKLREPTAVTSGIQKSFALILTFMFEHYRELSRLNANTGNWTILQNLKRELKAIEGRNYGTFTSQEKQEIATKMGLNVPEDNGIDISTAPKPQKADHILTAKEISDQLNHIFFTILKKMSTQREFTPKSSEMLIRVWFQAAREISLSENSLENFAGKTVSKAHLMDAYGPLSTLICQAWTDAGIKIDMNNISQRAKPQLAIVVVPKQKSPKNSKGSRPSSPVSRHNYAEFEEKKIQ